MKEITEAIATRRAQIKQLQADVDVLQRAATVLGGKTAAKATPAAQLTTTRQRPRPKTKLGRRPWSAARREAMSKLMSKRMKERWATKRAAKRGRKK